MAYLLIGGTGKTAIRLARLLQNNNHQFILTSRRGQSGSPQDMAAVRFDWTDKESWEEPFNYQFAGGEKIKAIYLVQPMFSEPWKPMIEFIDYAYKEKGVGRFVLVGGTSSEIGKAGMGLVWEHFLKIGVDYCVIRPSWFMENLSEEAPVEVIKKMNKIFTACDQGKIPFVSATDIAAVAYHTLTDPKSHNCDYRVVGPELLTYDQVAEKLSAALGREIQHVKLSSEDRFQSLVGVGLPDHFARFLTNIEVASAGGFETHQNDVVEKVTGRPPKTFDAYALENRAAWA